MTLSLQDQGRGGASAVGTGLASAAAPEPPSRLGPAGGTPGADADNTPHSYDYAAPDTCRKCGNGRDHPVHRARQQGAIA